VGVVAFGDRYGRVAEQFTEHVDVAARLKESRREGVTPIPTSE